MDVSRHGNNTAEQPRRTDSSSGMLVCVLDKNSYNANSCSAISLQAISWGFADLCSSCFIFQLCFAVLIGPCQAEARQYLHCREEFAEKLEVIAAPERKRRLAVGIAFSVSPWLVMELQTLSCAHQHPCFGRNLDTGAFMLMSGCSLHTRLPRPRDCCAFFDCLAAVEVALADEGRLPSG